MQINKAYSTIKIKEVDEEQRIIRGVASTPNTDRHGDKVLAEGAKFTLPIPLLWQHNHDQPIGSVVAAKVVDGQIQVEAKLAKVDAPSQLAARLEEAWQSIKSGLVRGLSIGFKPIKYAFIEDGDGVEFTEWDWFELSAVTIPANSEASITAIKSFSEQQDASVDKAVQSKPALGQKSVKLTSPKQTGEDMNYQEMIKRLEATIAEKQEARDSIQKQVADEGRTKDAAEREAFDTLNDEIKSLNLEIKDLRDLEAQNIKSAKPVTEEKSVEQAANYSGIVIKQAPEKLEKGIEFARMAMCIGSARGDMNAAMHIAQKRYPQMERMNEVIKAAVTGGTTLDASFAGNLVDYTTISNDFIEFLRPRTILGRFGEGNIPSLRSIPFNVTIKGQNAASTAGWVGEGKHKPVTKGGYSSVNLGWQKLAAISVASDELLRFSNPSAERLIRDDLAAAIIEQMDKSFIEVGNTGVNNVKPASITYQFNGSATTIPAGTTSPEADIAGLWSIADTGNLDTTSAVFITTPAIARLLSGLKTVADNPRFPEVTPFGGFIQGVPVIVSNYVDTDAFILAFASEIWLADDGVVTLDASREASIIMDSDPQTLVDNVDNETNFAPQAVNMFQTNNVAFRAERYVNWKTRRANVVNAVKGTSWA